MELFVNHLQFLVGAENIKVEKDGLIDPIGDMEENYNWILRTA